MVNENRAKHNTKKLDSDVKVSVFMPVFNSEDYLNEAIDSILNQTYSNFELIVLNDGSTDRSKDIVFSYSDSRIKYFENEKNMGLAYSRNRGLDLCSREYIAIFDSDDVCKKNRLELQLKVLSESPNTIVCGGDSEVISKHGTQRHRSTNYHLKVVYDSPVINSTAMIRNSFITKNKIRYDLDLPPAEDFGFFSGIFWLNKMDPNTFKNIPKILVKYRIHSGQTSQIDSDIGTDVATSIRRSNLQHFLSHHKTVFEYKHHAVNHKTVNAIHRNLVRLNSNGVLNELIDFVLYYHFLSGNYVTKILLFGKVIKHCDCRHIVKASLNLLGRKYGRKY
ncbi:MAG: glycosyltransferase involved in cell wall biosynthesis [bacterium]|jgi:glycosyltransferase involved in cell wall biosynthesis